MYLDTAILVKLVVREPDSHFYASLVEGGTSVWSCELAIPECRSALERKRRQGELEPRTVAAAWKRLEAMWGPDGGVRLHPVGRPLLTEAEALLREVGTEAPLRTLDAIHLAACRICRSFPLVSNDRIMRSAATILAISLSPLPKDL